MAAVLGAAFPARVLLAERGPATSTRPHEVRLAVATGIDVLQAEHFARLEGRRVALLTNLAAHTRTGVTTLDAFRAARNLVALFVPEHGLTASSDGRVASGRDDRTGLPVYSLYGEMQAPRPRDLAGVDVVAIDLPDIGARFYTYAATMAYMLEEAAMHDVKVLVLDRPNLGSTARMIGDQPTVRRITNGDDPLSIVQSWSADEARWRDTRSRYLLYP